MPHHAGQASQGTRYESSRSRTWKRRPPAVRSWLRLLIGLCWLSPCLSLCSCGSDEADDPIVAENPSNQEPAPSSEPPVASEETKAIPPPVKSSGFGDPIFRRRPLPPPEPPSSAASTSTPPPPTPSPSPVPVVGSTPRPTPATTDIRTSTPPPAARPPEPPVKPIELSAVVPPKLDQPRVEYGLPGVIQDLCWAAGGRYLLLHLAEQKQLAVFVVNVARIVRYMPANSTQFKFAAGRTKLVTVDGDRHTLSRYDLASGRRELTAVLQWPYVTDIALGHSSEGPIVLAGGHQESANGLALYALSSLSKLEFEGSAAARQLRMSADGQVLGARGECVTLTGNKLSSHELRLGNKTAGECVQPSADGSTIYAERGIYTSDGVQFGDASQQGISLPGVTGPWYAILDHQADQRSTHESLGIYLQGDTREILPLVGLPSVQDPDRYGRNRCHLSLDRRILFHPAARLLICIPTTADRLQLVHCDLDRALLETQVDYLFVSSQPPLTVGPGERVTYQVKVKSKRGGVRYSIASGPAGLTISAQANLTWNVPLDARSDENVIVKVKDAAGQEVLHYFRLHVEQLAMASAATTTPAAGSDPAVGRTPAPASSPAAKQLDLSDIVPARLDQPRVELRLPGVIHDHCWAAGGRYLLLHLPNQQQLAVFDVNVARIVHYLPAESNEFHFAAGATKLVTIVGDAMSRYDLATGQHELSVTLPQVKVVAMSMGHSSEGPIALSTSGGVVTTLLQLYSLSTLKQFEFERGAAVGDRLRMSANGQVLATCGRNVGVCRRVTWSGTRIHSQELRAEDMRLASENTYPSGDGGTIYTDRGIFNSQGVKTSDPSQQGTCLASVTGPYYAIVDHLDKQRHTAESLKVYVQGDAEPVLTLSELPVVQEADRSGLSRPSLDRRMLFHPEAGLVICIPKTVDRLLLVPFDLERALQESKSAYLFVTSLPPASVRPGEQVEYQVKVASKQGVADYSVKSGPPGLMISDRGKITWSVPADARQDENVMVLVTDEFGKEVFHSFRLRMELPVPAKGVQVAGQPAASRPVSLGIRKWHVRSGRMFCEARYGGVQDHEVILTLESGKQMTLPMADLSDLDRGYLEALGERLVVPNPPRSK